MPGSACAWAASFTRSSSPPAYPNEGVTTMTDDVNARIDEKVKGSDVLLFMKGSPLFPQCGFSSRSDERRVGKECVSTCRSRRSPDHEKQKASKATTQPSTYTPST